MKMTGALFLILGILLLVGAIASLFAKMSPTLMGVFIILSIIFNAVGITMLTSKSK